MSIAAREAKHDAGSAVSLFDAKFTTAVGSGFGVQVSKCRTFGIVGSFFAATPCANRSCVHTYTHTKQDGGGAVGLSDAKFTTAVGPGVEISIFGVVWSFLRPFDVRKIVTDYVFC